MEDYQTERRGVRSDFRRDFDRLVFSSPFRRLQNKTQVFPLPGSIFVHNRLTHSLEVASVGRSLASEAALLLAPGYADDPAVLAALDSAEEIVAAACLAHDLGNPPFGHSGEKAISTFFSEGGGAHLRERVTEAQWADLVHFEGNANAFRLLTHRFEGRRHGGFAMTYSTLASIVKYPYSSLLAGGRDKFGFFTSEAETFERIADKLGMVRHSAPGEPLRFARHPLVYIVEAADDICYEVMDLEDAHRLKIFSTDQVTDLFLAFFDSERQQRMHRAMARLDDPNEKVAYMRSAVIGCLVKACACAFAANETQILAGSFAGRLLDCIPTREKGAYEACNAASWDKIYRAREVVDIELAGNRMRQQSARWHLEMQWA